MQIISWNVNGIRAVYQRGFLKWLTKSRADIVCLQELKAQAEQLPADLLKPKNYSAYFNLAARKGYSGVAVYTKIKPVKTENKLGLKRFDQEGRILKLKYPHFTLINVYLPHGGRQKENLDYKLKVYQRLLNYLKKIKDKSIILIGDFNIAHQEIDLARPKDNQNNIMFTPAEREQLDQLINLGFTDTFRKLHQKGGHYTWWSYFNNCRQHNLGWRIDYAFTRFSRFDIENDRGLTLRVGTSERSRSKGRTSESAVKRSNLKLKSAFILNHVPGSDHCPIGIEVSF